MTSSIVEKIALSAMITLSFLILPFLKGALRLPSRRRDFTKSSVTSECATSFNKEE